MKKIPTKEELDNSIQQEMAEVTTRQARIDRAILRLQALRKRLSVLMGLRDLLTAYEAETETAALTTPAKKKPAKKIAAAKPEEKVEDKAEAVGDALKAAFETYRGRAETRGHRLGRFIFVSDALGWKARCKCGARLHVSSAGTVGLGDALTADCSYEWPKNGEKVVEEKPAEEKPVKVRGKPGPKPKGKSAEAPVKGRDKPKGKSATRAEDDDTHGGLLQPGSTAYGNFVTMLKGVKALAEENGHKISAFEQDPKGYTARCLHCRKVVRLSRIGTQTGLALKEMCA
jgi:hypothetical protein